VSAVVFRRPHVLLRRVGFIVNHKRLFRLYREEPPHDPPARRGLGHTGATGSSTMPNDRW
jgi:putative transposase